MIGYIPKRSNYTDTWAGFGLKNAHNLRLILASNFVPCIEIYKLIKEEMKIPKNSEIQGALILSDGCYRNQNNDLIIPDGKYLGEIFNQMPYGRINKKVTGIGATTLELESKRNSIIVVPSQYLAFSKSETSKDYLYVGGEISGKISSTTVADVRKHFEDKDIQDKKFICVAESLWKVMNVISKELDQWFIMLDEIDTFQEQANFREGLEVAVDYYLLFNTENKCLVSATLKDFSNERLNDQPLLTINIEKPSQRHVFIVCSENIYQALFYEIQRLAEFSPEKAEKIVVAYNVVRDSITCIENLPSDLNKDCSLLCSKSRKSDVGNYFGELDKGKLPARINFMTSAYYAGIDIHDTYHLIYVSNIKMPHTLLSVDKMHQIYGRARMKYNTEKENTNSVLSESLIHNSDETFKIGIEQTKASLLKYAAEQKQYAECVEGFYKAQGHDYNQIRSLQEAMLNDKKYMEYNYVRFKDDNKIEISYFNIDSRLENQSIRNRMYASPDSVDDHLTKAGFDVMSGRLSLDPKDIPENLRNPENTKNKNENSDREHALDYINENCGVNIDYFVRNSKGEERQFYRMYRNLNKFIDTDLLDIHLNKIRNYGLHTTRLRNFEKAVRFQTYEDDFPFKRMIMNQFKIGDEFDKDEIPKIMNAICNDPMVGIKKNFSKDTVMSEINLYVKFRVTRKGPERKRKLKVIGYNPKSIKVKDNSFALIINDKVQKVIPVFEAEY